MVKPKIIMTLSLLSTFVVGALGGAFMFPNEVEKEVPVFENVTIEKIVEVEKLVEVEKVVEVPVNVTVEVPVDNGNLESVLEHVYDNDGKVNYLLDDLDDDELDKIVDRIVFINEVKKLAVDAVEADLFDEIDRDLVGAVELDDRDMERLRVDDDADEVLIDDVDFDNGDADVIVTGSFEQDDVKYEFEAVLEFKDGEFDDFKSVDVVEA